jgi:hypothetical protein
VVICPGGGFMALSIDSEGIDVAKYLAARGVTTFVLKYRLAHTGEDATQEFTSLIADRQKFEETVGNVIPLAVADGLAAVTYVRQHASECDYRDLLPIAARPIPATSRNRTSNIGPISHVPIQLSCRIPGFGSSKRRTVRAAGLPSSANPAKKLMKDGNRRLQKKAI